MLNLSQTYASFSLKSLNFSFSASIFTEFRCSCTALHLHPVKHEHSSPDTMETELFTFCQHAPGVSFVPKKGGCSRGFLFLLFSFKLPRKCKVPRSSDLRWFESYGYILKKSDFITGDFPVRVAQLTQIIEDSVSSVVKMQD